MGTRVLQELGMTFLQRFPNDVCNIETTRLKHQAFIGGTTNRWEKPVLIVHGFLWFLKVIHAKSAVVFFPKSTLSL